MSTRPAADAATSDAGELACPHCGDPVAAAGAFCCSGCEVAWALVHEAGLEDYYARREQPGPRPEPLQGAWQVVPVRERDDGLVEASLCVDGLRCSSCTWVVERLLERSEGVEEATVSYANGRTRVVFDPKVVQLGDLARTVASVGYSPRPVDAPEGRDELLSRLGVSAFLTSNLMLLSASLYVGWFDGMDVRYATLFRWGSLVLATPIAQYAAAPFFQGAWRGLRAGAIGMDVPIALAVSVLYVHGVAQTLMGAEGYLDSLGMLVTLLLVGRVLERRGRRAAAEASAAIAASLPLTARRRIASGVEEVPVVDLVPGDVVEVGAGDEVPADGRVAEGTGRVQMALLTGEAEPVEVLPGSPVVAGASVVEGTLALAVDRVGEATTAIRMADAVREATARPMPRSPADALAPWFTAVTVGVAVLAGLGWGWVGGLEQGIQVAVATLVVACPCALGLSVPLSVAAGLGAVARRGVVFRDGGQLMALADVDTLAMDKTGTVTEGVPAVVEASDEALRLAGAVERASRHPVARAVLSEARDRGLRVPVATEVLEVPGVGIEGVVEGRRVRVRGAGAGAVAVALDDGAVHLIRVGDRPRADARQAVERLRNAGIHTVLLSGDHPDVTEAIGRSVGVDDAIGGCTPEAKADWIAARGVGFVGDGLNDGPALGQARVGLAMFSGVPSSLWVADGVVTQPALAPVVAAVAGARATRDAVRANLRRSILYNVLAVGAAVAGLVNPLVAALLMPLSSGLVIAGALTVPRRLARMEKQWTSS